MILMLIAAIVIAIVAIGIVHLIKRQRAVSQLLEKKLSNFMCPKCGNSEVSIGIFSTPINGTFYKVININNIEFTSQSCKKCGFAQPYLMNIVLERETGGLSEIKPKETFTCSKCKNGAGKQIFVAFTGTGLSRSYDLHSGEYHVDICDRCGYSEFIETKKASDSSGGFKLLGEMSILAREFECKRCSNKGGSSCVISAAGGDIFSKASNFQYIDLIAVSCNVCKFCDLYDRTIQVGENIFAVR